MVPHRIKTFILRILPHAFHRMSPQITPSHTCCICVTLVTLVAFVWLFFIVCVSNVFSNYLPGRMHSHNGCICLVFLHCVFSNVSSNCLPEMMHTHTGCTCLTFLHCAFSDDFSSHVLKKLQRCIGCTWLILPWCLSVFCHRLDADPWQSNSKGCPL